MCLITIPSGGFLNIKMLNFIFLFFSSSYRQIFLPFYPALQIHFVNTHLNLSEKYSSEWVNEWLLFNANSALSWREKINFQCDFPIFQANRSFLFHLNAVYLAEKQQISILKSLIWPDRGEHDNHYTRDVAHQFWKLDRFQSLVETKNGIVYKISKKIIFNY